MFLREKLLTFGLVLGSATAAVAAPCKVLPADQTAVAETVRTMYAGLMADDAAKFHAAVAADFLAFDGGKRYEGDALFDSIKATHASGKVYVFTVMEPKVEIDCDTAWITYVNRGSRTDSTGVQQITWLESAVLQRQAGTWRIRFFHATRVPDPQPPPKN